LQNLFSDDNNSKEQVLLSRINDCDSYCFDLMVAFSIVAGADVYQIGSSLQRYDPRCGMTREEYEWRCARAKTVDQLMPQMLERLDVLLQMTRPHFLDDPKTLQKWDDYAGDVCHTFKNNLRTTLMAPVSIPVSLLSTVYVYCVKFLPFEGKEESTRPFSGSP
jgi:hypothetical protein